MKTDKIYVVGFMAAGKSTVARALAARLGWRVDDIDDCIEARERQTIAEIFAGRGEPYFRRVEREMLLGLLPVRHSVVATGGGTFVDPANRAIIKDDGVSVWLDVPFEEVVQRVPSDRRRPLAQDRTEFERLFAARQIAYRQAHLRLDAARAPTAELVERTLDWLGW